MDLQVYKTWVLQIWKNLRAEEYIHTYITSDIHTFKTNRTRYKCYGIVLEIIKKYWKSLNIIESRWNWITYVNNKLSNDSHIRKSLTISSEIKAIQSTKQVQFLGFYTTLFDQSLLVLIKMSLYWKITYR